MQKYDDTLFRNFAPCIALRRAWRLTSIISFFACFYLLITGTSPLTPLSLSNTGRDELCIAAYHGDVSIMAFLLNEGADINRVGWESHFTPLGDAARSGNLSSIRYLLARGADPNRCGDWPQTPMDLAHLTKHFEAAHILKEAGGVSFSQLPREKQHTQ